MRKKTRKKGPPKKPAQPPATAPAEATREPRNIRYRLDKLIAHYEQQGRAAAEIRVDRAFNTLRKFARPVQNAKELEYRGRRLLPREAWRPSA